MAKAAIFDVDGTLVDSVDLHASAWQEALIKFGHPVTFEQARSQIGKGGDQLIPVFLSEAEERIMARRWRNGVASCSDRNTFLSCGHSPRSRSCCDACVKLA